MRSEAQINRLLMLGNGLSFAMLVAAFIFAGLALSQNYGPRSGPVTWSFAVDSGFAQGAYQPLSQELCSAYSDDGGAASDGGGIVYCNTYYDAGPFDGGVYDAGIQTGHSCTDAGFATWQGSWTCDYVWVDAGYNYSDDTSKDGGFYDAGCTDAGVQPDGGYQGCAPFSFDAGIALALAPPYFNDGGFGDGGPASPTTASNYSWLPVASAIYNGTVYSDWVPFAGWTTAAGCDVLMNVSANVGAQTTGTLCLDLGYSPGNYSSITCDQLDGGVGPFDFAAAGVTVPGFNLSYTPAASDDGGYLHGQFSIRQ